MVTPWTRVVAVGLVLGLVAGCVVWWLERFEVEKMHSQFREYLDRYDRFKEWEASHGGDGGD